MNINEIITLILNVGFSSLLSFVFYMTLSKDRNRIIVSLLSFTISFLLIGVALWLIPISALRMVVLYSALVVMSFVTVMKWYNRLIFAAVFFAISGVCEYVIASILSVIFHENISTLSSGNLFVMGMLLSKALIFAIIVVIRIGKHKPFSTKFHRRYIPLLFVPIATLSVFFIQFDFYSRTENKSLELSIPAAICYSLLLLSNVVVFNMVDSVQKSVEQETKLGLAGKLIEKQNESYKDLIEQSKEVLRIRHDQKNFLLGLTSDLDAEDYEGARRAVHDEYNKIEVLPLNFSIGNVFQLLVETKQSTIDDENISIDFDSQNLSAINIPAVDIAILLGNAIDNSIEAVKRIPTSEEKIIKVAAKVHNRQIIIVISNPIASKVDTTNFVSSKKVGNHGFGLISMNRIVEKYDGEILFESSDSEFIVRIILRNPVDQEH